MDRIIRIHLLFNYRNEASKKEKVLYQENIIVQNFFCLVAQTGTFVKPLSPGQSGWAGAHQSAVRGGRNALCCVLCVLVLYGSVLSVFFFLCSKLVYVWWGATTEGPKDKTGQTRQTAAPKVYAVPNEYTPSKGWALNPKPCNLNPKPSFPRAMRGTHQAGVEGYTNLNPQQSTLKKLYKVGFEGI